MTEPERRPEAIARDAGLTVLGEAGSAADALSVRRALGSPRAVPEARVPMTEDDSDAVALHDAVLTLACEHGIASEAAEVLLSVEADGPMGPWLRVRATDLAELDVMELGRHVWSPSFVVSDVGRTVSLGVVSDEHDYLVMVSRTDPATGETPVPSAPRRLARRAGLVVLGESLALDEVWLVSRELRDVEPQQRVVAAGRSPASVLRDLRSVVAQTVREHRLVSSDGELLLASGGMHGPEGWLRVRWDGAPVLPALADELDGLEAYLTDLERTVFLGIRGAGTHFEVVVVRRGSDAALRAALVAVAEQAHPSAPELIDAMTAAALFVDDADWLERRFVELLCRDDENATACAASCLRHVASRFGRLDLDAVGPRLESLARRPGHRLFYEQILRTIRGIVVGPVAEPQT